MFRISWVHPQGDSCKRKFLYGMFTRIGVRSLAGGTECSRFETRRRRQKLKKKKLMKILILKNVFFFGLYPIIISQGTV
jgi:hypothetical protein